MPMRGKWPCNLRYSTAICCFSPAHANPHTYFKFPGFLIALKHEITVSYSPFVGYLSVYSSLARICILKKIIDGKCTIRWSQSYCNCERAHGPIERQSKVPLSQFRYRDWHFRSQFESDNQCALTNRSCPVIIVTLKAPMAMPPQTYVCLCSLMFFYV